ncbi:hypothetical protein [Paenibacillus sp. PAMC 26794]|uniref:hypothetical protein n=1 Tax=Paenibacillus sp. PAMC 26794 TaxID=1257080 RepID=UPI0002E31CE3|nr:hypothetical protein [Paenibacillus sp. PAMC 26794]
MITKELIERVRDVAIVLKISKSHNQKLGRLQLQKILYLVDSLVVCRHIISATNGYETYHHGPYDQKIQNAADLLGFWGLVNITDIVVNNGKIVSNYEITGLGEEWVEELISNSESIFERHNVVEAICESLSNRNAFNRVKDLVYAEPTYSRLGHKGYGHKLDLSNYETNLTIQVIIKMETMFKMDKIEMSDRFMADFLIEFLEQRSMSKQYNDDNDWID